MHEPARNLCYPWTISEKREDTRNTNPVKALLSADFVLDFGVTEKSRLSADNARRFKKVKIFPDRSATLKGQQGRSLRQNDERIRVSTDNFDKARKYRDNLIAKRIRSGFPSQRAIEVVRGQYVKDLVM